MKKLVLAFALIVVSFAFVPVTVSAASRDKNYVRFVNYSGYDVVVIYAAFSDERNWGRNLMNGYVMRYNQYYDIYTNYRDYYDFKIVTKGGSTCTVRDVWMDSDMKFIFDGDRCYVQRW